MLDTCRELRRLLQELDGFYRRTGFSTCLHYALQLTVLSADLHTHTHFPKLLLTLHNMVLGNKDSIPADKAEGFSV